LNRGALQQLSNERIADAKALLAAARWAGAYYLVGYSLECALKSCILARIEQTGIIFENKKFAEACWTHDLNDLVDLAGLKLEKDKACKANSKFGTHWMLAKDWSESSRYQLSTQPQAENLFDAISDNSDGVLPWVRKYW